MRINGLSIDVYSIRKYFWKNINVGFDDLQRPLKPLRDSCNDLQCWAFSQIVYIRFERQTVTGDDDILFSNASGDYLFKRIEHVLHHPARLAIVHFASGMDQACGFRCRAHNKPGIYGNAVSTDARTGLEDVYAWMLIREMD